MIVGSEVMQGALGSFVSLINNHNNWASEKKGGKTEYTPRTGANGAL